MESLEILHNSALGVLGVVLAGVFGLRFMLHFATDAMDTAATALRFIIRPELRKFRSGLRELDKALRDLGNDDDADAIAPAVPNPARYQMASIPSSPAPSPGRCGDDGAGETQSRTGSLRP